jgi:hypothetical protein
MTADDVLSIVIPAVALGVLAVPGQPRWTRRPLFVRRLPPRRMLALFFAAMAAVAVIHALG